MYARRAGRASLASERRLLKKFAGDDNKPREARSRSTGADRRMREDPARILFAKYASRIRPGETIGFRVRGIIRNFARALIARGENIAAEMTAKSCGDTLYWNCGRNYYVTRCADACRVQASLKVTTPVATSVVQPRYVVQH